MNEVLNVLNDPSKATQNISTACSSMLKVMTFVLSTLTKRPMLAAADSTRCSSSVAVLISLKRKAI